jgi:methyl-accepting chemotaxis protein
MTSAENSASLLNRMTKPTCLQDLLLSGYLTLGLVLICGGVLQLVATEQLMARFDTQLGADAPAHELLLNIDRDSYQAQLAVERLAASPIDADLSGLLDDYQSNLDQTWTRWTDYTDVARGLGDEKSRWPAYVDARDQWAASLAAVIEAVEAGERADDPAMAERLAATKADHEALRVVLDGIVEELYAPVLNALPGRLTQGTWISRILVFATIIVGGLLALRVAGRTSTKLAGALRELQAKADEMARGRTDIEIPTQDLAELNELADALNTLATSRGEAAAYAEHLAGGNLALEFQPKSSHDVLGNALVELRRGLTDIIASASSAAGEVTKQVGELYNVTPDRADDQQSEALLAQALRSAVDMVGEAHDGANSVTQGTDTMEAVNAAMAEIDTIVADLTSHSSDVSDAVSFIRDVAEQTNLLALNASIEAARAGDAGRGFAVVANEVKGLATEAASSTDRVAEVVEAMARSVQKLAASTALGRAQVAEGSEVMDLASTSFSEISRGVDEVRHRIQDATTSGSEIAASLTGAERRLNAAIGQFELETAHA